MKSQHAEVPSAEPPYDLRVGLAARLLGVSTFTLRRYEADGRISSRRTPTGHRRFRRVDIEKLRDETNASEADA